jgi:hypothetical protein
MEDRRSQLSSDGRSIWQRRHAIEEPNHKKCARFVRSCMPLLFDSSTLYPRFGKVAFLALLALCEFNNLRGINQVIRSTPAAFTDNHI